MEQELQLYYSGARLQHGMTAEDMAQAIVGFAKLSRSAAVSAFGPDSVQGFKIETVKPGSSVITGFLELAPVVMTTFGVVPDPISGLALSKAAAAHAVTKVIRAWVDIARHLNGKPAKQVIKSEEGSSSIQLVNSENNTINVTININNSYNQNDVGKILSDLSRPLRGEATNFDLSINGENAVSANDNDISSFRSTRSGSEFENVGVVLLKVTAPVLEGDGVWRFTNGRNRITATIEDKDYLDKVHKGQESFKAGDILRVRLKSIQQRIGGTIRVTHTVEQVLGKEI